MQVFADRILYAFEALQKVGDPGPTLLLLEAFSRCFRGLGPWKMDENGLNRRLGGPETALARRRRAFASTSSLGTYLENMIKLL